jgi:hypothetical protein
MYLRISDTMFFSFVSALRGLSARLRKVRERMTFSSSSSASLRATGEISRKGEESSSRNSATSTTRCSGELLVKCKLRGVKAVASTNSARYKNRTYIVRNALESTNFCRRSRRLSTALFRFS